MIPSLVDFLYSPGARRTRRRLSDYPFCCKEFPWEYLPLLCLTLTHLDLDSNGPIHADARSTVFLLQTVVLRVNHPKVISCSAKDHTVFFAYIEHDAAGKLCAVCILTIQVQFSPQISGVQ